MRSRLNDLKISEQNDKKKKKRNKEKKLISCVFFVNHYLFFLFFDGQLTLGAGVCGEGGVAAVEFVCVCQ